MLASYCPSQEPMEEFASQGSVLNTMKQVGSHVSQMSGVPRQKQYFATMNEAFHYVQQEWAATGRTILGERGFCAIHIQSVRKSHPALPVFMQAFVETVTASNGAMLELWGSDMPIALWVVNINYSQQSADLVPL